MTLIYSAFFKRRIVLFSAIFFLGIVLFVNCKKPDNQVGLGVQPQSDQLNLVIIDTTSIDSYSADQDAIQTDELTGDNLLGSYNDPFFGKVNATIYSQIRLESSIDFTPSSGSLTDLVVDSAILYLGLTGSYGNLQPQTFEVYQLTEDIYLDSTYYSNSSISHSSTNLVSTGQGVITPDPSGFGTVAGELQNESILRIPLDVNDFGWNIINQSGTGILNGNDGTSEFVNWFKGLAIKVNNPMQNTNEGAILYTNLLSANSKIILFYRDTTGLTSEHDTLDFDININSSCARFNGYDLDYTNTDVEAILADSTNGEQLFFLQTMGGVKAKIAFPYIENYIQEGNIVVNKAELILPVQYYSSDPYLPVSELFILRSDNDGEEQFLPDFTENQGGVFDFTTNSYTFNITRYINQLFAGNFSNNPLTLIANGAGVSANRVVFNGAGTSFQDKPILRLTYTNY